MCLIISKPKFVSIPPVLLEDAYQSNHDGWGIMYAHLGELYTRKGFALDDLQECVESLGDIEMYVHLRMRTHGEINIANIHPFEITKDIYLMHNGILDIDQESKEESDTAAFVRMIQPMLQANPDLMFDDGFIQLVSRFSKGSRLVFLHSCGYSQVIHEDQGIEWEGLWCSNTYAWTLWEKVEKPSKKKVSKKKAVANNYWREDDQDDFDYHLSRSDRSLYDDTCDYDKVTMRQLQGMDYEELYAVILDYPDEVILAIYAS